MLAVVDAGPLYATADSDDADHEQCRETLSRADLRLVIPALVVAEATYFVGGRLGARAERPSYAASVPLTSKAPPPMTSIGWRSLSGHTPTSHSEVRTPA